MSIINELERIRAGKEELRQALLAKGAVLTEGALIDEYAAAVNNISVGGPTLPEATCEVVDDKVEITAGIFGEDKIIPIPHGDVNIGDDSISVTAGYVFDELIPLPASKLHRDGNLVWADPGWFMQKAEIEVPTAKITETETSVTIGVGYVAEEKTYQLSAGDTTSIRFGVIDEDGKFQPLDVTVAPPTLEGVGEEGDYYIINTGLPYPDGEEAALGGGENNYYVCTAIQSDTEWQGYKVVIDNGALSTEGDAVTCNISGTIPTIGKIYDNKAQWLIALAQPVITVSPRKDIGGQVNDKIGVKFIASAENKSADEISYTLVDAPDWLALDGTILSGTPTTAGTYSATVRVETDGFMPVLMDVGIDIIAEKTDAILYLPLNGQQSRAETGQYLVWGKGIHNPSQHYSYLEPEYVTFDGYRCAKFIAGYTWDDVTGEENSFITSVETNELANIVDTAPRTVSFLACPQVFYRESEYGNDTYWGAPVIEWGQGGSERMFKVCVAYEYFWDEDTGEDGIRHIVCVDLYNYYVTINTGLSCDNKMHHYVLSMDCTGSGVGTMKLYVDGNAVWSGWFSSGVVTPHTVNSPISIGKMYGDNGYNFEGYIAEVKVWNKILTASDVSTEYNRVTALRG